MPRYRLRLSSLLAVIQLASAFSKSSPSSTNLPLPTALPPTPHPHPQPPTTIASTEKEEEEERRRRNTIVIMTDDDDASAAAAANGGELEFPPPRDHASHLLIDGWFHERNNPLWPGQAFALQVKEILYHERSKFQDVLVFESESYGRVLVLDGVIQATERDEHR
jgi:hypothetical protein